MGVILDTSALIGLHEAEPEVVDLLAAALEQYDDGAAPMTHQVVLGELWVGVLAVGSADAPDNPRRQVLDTARSLDIETIEPQDAETFAHIASATNRTIGHNDRWICAAAIRTRSTLITQDGDMAGQIARYFTSLSLLDTLAQQVPIVCVPRDRKAAKKSGAVLMTNVIEMTAEIQRLFSRLDPQDAEVLSLRFGLDRGAPRTLTDVANHLQLKPSRIAQIEKRALNRLRSDHC